MSFSRAFVKPFLQFESSRMDAGVAFRNTVGVTFPLAVGLFAGSPEGGMVAGLGALMVSYSDGPEPYPIRARRMFFASAASSAVVLAGSLSASHGLLSIWLAALWAFGAGFLVVLGAAAGSFGVASLTLFVVFAASPVPPATALAMGGLALLGGFLQAALALFLWPIRRYAPERRALGRLYLHLASFAESPIVRRDDPLGSEQMNAAQLSLSSLERDSGEEPLRYRSLLSQAERARVRLISLSRLRRRIERESPGNGFAPEIARFLESASGALAAVGKSLALGAESPGSAEAFLEVEKRLEHARDRREERASGFLAVAMRDALAQMEALGGQLRAARDLARSAAPEAAIDFTKTEDNRAWWRRDRGRVATLRANLTLESPGFRHAVRLSAAISLGETLAHALAMERAYWIPLTIGVVLRPEFSATFSRAFLRLGGTLGGLGLATGLYVAFRPGRGAEVAMIAGFTFILRWLGAAHYGFLSLGLSGLVVVLFALVGVPPQEIVAARALNTILGGAIALLAYVAWPTPEERLFSETVARMLEAYREYFRAVLTASADPEADPKLESLRLRARLARSTLNASIERLQSEPRTTEERNARLAGIQASANRFAHAVMAIEAASRPAFTREGAQALSELVAGVEATLGALGELLRAPAPGARRLPALREACDRFARAEGELPERRSVIQIEADRVTNSLLTLGEQLQAWRRETRPGTRPTT